MIADLIWYLGERDTHQSQSGIHVPFFIHCHAPISIVIYALLLIISDSGSMKHNPLEGVGHLLCDRWSHMEVPL